MSRTSNATLEGMRLVPGRNSRMKTLIKSTVLWGLHYFFFQKFSKTVFTRKYKKSDMQHLTSATLAVQVPFSEEGQKCSIRSVSEVRSQKRVRSQKDPLSAVLP